MRLSLTLRTAPGAGAFSPQRSVLLAWALLSALADLMRSSTALPSHQLIPTFTTSSVSMDSEVEDASDLMNGVESTLAGLHKASTLLCAAEQLMHDSLADRVLIPGARLPVPVIHVHEACEVLAYDRDQDVIQCRYTDWDTLVTKNVKALMVLADIAAAQLAPELELAGDRIRLPDVSPTLFRHGVGAGRSQVSAAFISGMYLVAEEIEIRIDRCRNNRVLRAQLSDAARLIALERHPPYTAAVQYAEAVPHLPLLPAKNGTVVIERLWDIEAQLGLQLS